MLIYPGAFNMTTGPLHWELLQRARCVAQRLLHFYEFFLNIRSNCAGRWTIKSISPCAALRETLLQDTMRCVRFNK